MQLRAVVFETSATLPVVAEKLTLPIALAVGRAAPLLPPLAALTR